MIPFWLAANWKIPVAALLGALLCWPVASCQGHRDANAAYDARIIAASAKVTEAAAKAESAAILADMARHASTAKEAEELKDIINETKSEAVAGPAVSAVLRELRERRGGAARSGS